MGVTTFFFIVSCGCMMNFKYHIFYPLPVKLSIFFYHEKNKIDDELLWYHERKYINHDDDVDNFHKMTSYIEWKYTNLNQSKFFHFKIYVNYSLVSQTGVSYFIIIEYGFIQHI